MSLSGTTNTYLPPTLDGLNIIEADAVYINGIPIDTVNLVPYTGASKNVNLGTFNFQTLGSMTAKQHVFPTFGSTMMTGTTTSSIFYADAWEFNNTIQISSLGGGAFLSTSYLRLADGSNNSTLLTLQSDGIADFANTKVRVSTMAANVYDVVNLSTLTSAVAFITNVNALNYVPYTGALQDLTMGGSTITTTGLMSAGAVRITSSIANTDYSMSVSGSNFLEFTNLTTAQKIYTDGGSLWLPGNNYCSGIVYSNDLQLSGTSYLGYGTIYQYGTSINGSGRYQIADNTGNAILTLSKTTGLTVSTMNITQVPSATPTLALGVNGGGQVVSFAVPTTSGLVPYTGATTTVNLGAQSIFATTARFTGVTSATPTLALGVDGSGNLNTFAVPSGGGLLTSNNTFTGTNQFNNSIVVYNGLGVASGTFSKQTATVGSLVQITGGGATNSPYLEFLFGGNSRGYIGNASAVDLDLVAQNGAKLNFYTAGTKRLEIDTAGAVNCLGSFRKSNDVNPTTSHLSIFPGGASNTPYIDFTLNGTRLGYIGYATTGIFNFNVENGPFFNLNVGGGNRLQATADGYVITRGVGVIIADGRLTIPNQPFCIVGGVAGASVGYGVGGVWGSGSQMFAYTSAGMSNSGTSGWSAGAGAFFFTQTGKWQVNWSFYWNNFAGGSRGQLLHYNSAGTLLENRYCALNQAGIGADTTMAYGTLIYGSVGDYLQCNFQSGSGTLYFGGITHTHATFYFCS